jgi:hypothetical protein
MTAGSAAFWLTQHPRVLVLCVVSDVTVLLTVIEETQNTFCQLTDMCRI